MRGREYCLAGVTKKYINPLWEEKQLDYIRTFVTHDVIGWCFCS